MTQSNNRKDWISLASVISCIAVVFLHTNGCFWTFSTERYWFTANIIECVFYFAVPVFFMISGATLINHRERYSTKEFFKKRIEKTVVPFITWSLIGIAYKLALGDILASEITIKYIWNGIVNTTIVSIYWFFPTLFGIYLSIPLFAAIEKSLRKDVFTYAAVAGFIFGGVPLICNTVLKGFTWNLNITAAAGYLTYVLIGYLISEYGMDRRTRYIVYACGLIGLAAHIAGTYYLSIAAGEIVSTFKGYVNVPCVMYSTAIFVWVRYNGDRLIGVKIIRNIANWISPYTMCIYLMQYFIFTTMIRAFEINTHSIIYRLGAPFVIIPIAILVAWVVRKIPYGKHIMP